MITQIRQAFKDSVKPTVGAGCTMLGYSDRHPGTITAVSPSGKSFKFKRDMYTRVDNNGVSENQEYTFAPDPNAFEQQARLHKDGAFYCNGTRVAVGYRSAYYDYSF